MLCVRDAHDVPSSILGVEQLDLLETSHWPKHATASKTGVWLKITTVLDAKRGCKDCLRPLMFLDFALYPELPRTVLLHYLTGQDELQGTFHRP